MKYTITKEKIELNYSLYKIIIPNNESFECSFEDNRKFMGNLKYQVGLTIESKDKKYEPGYGGIIKFFNYFFVNPTSQPVSGDIYGLSDIEKFLLEAKENGYKVDDVLNEVSLAKQVKITFFGKETKEL